MLTAQQIKADMKVRDPAGQLVGIVDHVDQDGVGLKREGFADGLHHFVPLAAVMRIEEDGIVVEPSQVTSVEAIEGAILYARRRSMSGRTDNPLFGTSGHGTGSGGGGF